MAKEIERKFLVTSEDWRDSATAVQVMRQGYLSYEPERTVRIRATDSTGFLTIKGMTKGITRDEFEYEIPLADALALLELSKHPAIEKKRFFIPEEGKWISLKLSTRALKTINKNGISSVLKEAKKQGLL